MTGKPFLILLFALLLYSCQKETVETPFPYPESKAWAHRVNTLEEARLKSSVFQGLEIDLQYNPNTDQLLLGHDPEDTLGGIDLDSWLEAIEQPSAHYYWLDMKNLSTGNATRIAQKLAKTVDKWQISNHVMIEQWDVSALKIMKKHGFHVILWVDNPYRLRYDDEGWQLAVQEDIDNLHPDALSGNYQMFPLLPESFPEQNIHLWDTPKEYTEDNVAHTRLLMQHPAVKVVLVDYPEPVTP